VTASAHRDTAHGKAVGGRYVLLLAAGGGGPPAALAAVGAGGGGGGQLGGDARPSRDPELQSDAALGAVVTRVWLPTPRCPAHGGLASGPGKAEQVRPRGPRAAARPAAAGRPGGGRREDSAAVRAAFSAPQHSPAQSSDPWPGVGAVVAGASGEEQQSN
jgi:hypothetical protein